MNEDSSSTIDWYRRKLPRFLKEVDPDRAKTQDIETFLLQFANPGNRHGYYRVLRTFYGWRERTFDLPSPVKNIEPPRLGKLIMPSLTKAQVIELLEHVSDTRNKAIIALFVKSGLRLTELVTVGLPFTW